MKRTLYTLILGVLALSSYADIRNGWMVYGRSINSFTFERIKGTVVELMQTDSTVVQTDTIPPTMDFFQFIVDGTQKEYILRLSHPDYETTYKNLTLELRKRERTIEIGNVPMRRLTRLEKGITLDEVEIVTSKVQFYHKGDTLIYDATAFQIAEGSMLDALIEQLPGAEINEDGQIYVNGRFVESLLLNGEEFFNGKQEIMLQNLPAYTVKSLNVYEKESEESRRLGYKVDEGNFVMDVKLKREYNVGWLANTELGGGTKERYAGRAFALRFSDLSRVSAFANLNNLNDNRKPGQNGNWQPSDLSGGLMESQTGGLDYMVNGQNQKRSHKLQGNVFVTHTDKDIRRTSSSTTFLPDGDVYGYGRNSQDNENFSISTWHKWQFSGSNNRYNSYIDSYVSPSINYSQSNSLYNNANAAFLDNYLQSPELLDSLLNGDVSPMRPFVNRLSQAQKSTGSNFNGQLQGFFHFEIPHTDDAVSISATASYNDRKNRQFDKYILEYPTATSDVRDRYFDMPYKGYNFNGEVNYFHRIQFYESEQDGMWFINPRYMVSHQTTTTTNHLYRLDQLEEWTSIEDYPLGTLPSMQDAMMSVLDTDNSYISTERSTIHTARLQVRWSRTKRIGNQSRTDQVAFYPRVNIQSRSLDYGGSQSVNLTRNEVMFNPSMLAQFALDSMKHRVRFEYAMNPSAPSLMNLLDHTFDSDPLNIRRGNPNLKNTHTHHARFQYQADQWLSGTGKMLNTSLEYTYVRNAVAMGYIYDKSTGVRTTTPDNVNGNWKLAFAGNYTLPLDRQRKLTLQSNMQIDYSDNADLVGINGAEVATKRIVHNLWARETLTLNYRMGEHRIGAKVRASTTHATSERADFNEINAYNFNYGLTGLVNLPYKMQLSTDITMYTRRGYADANMNTSELVWNARLTKSAMKGNLLFTLDGFDILGNLSTINYSVNGQGRTEVWTNSIPRYVMLKVSYKLHKQPKRK